MAASLFSFALAGTYFSGEDIAGMALIMCAVLAVGFQDFMAARHNPHPRTNELSAQPADAESSAGSDGAESAGSDGASPADTVGAASSAAKTPAAVK